ncbi:hypothetical protein ACFVWR_08790 [Leifsonia sp. NPDC058292]|uniref:hypothetical protein n=1 Tax=Leifsonia sp. NPDC058292 TaxID=3346428 RepID=UPI0036DADEC8
MSGSPRASAETSTPTRFRAATLYAIGLALVAVALALLVWFLLLTADRGHLEDLVGGEDWGSNLVAAPFLVLMVAAAPLFLAEYTRRGQWRSRNRTFLQGGSNVVLLRPLALWARLLWLLVALAAWFVLIPLPVATSAVRGDEFWMLLTAYGFFAAGMVGAILGSLLKRATYERLASAFGARVKRASRSQIFWRMVSYQFRLELIFAFLCTALLGMLPLTVRDDDPVAAAWLIGLAAGCGVLAIVGILNAWRSGKALYSLESVS